MNLKTILQFVQDHLLHGQAKYPDVKTEQATIDQLVSRIDDLQNALARDDVQDHKLVAGKRCLQIAALAIRAIEDLDLGTVPPAYDAGVLNHTEPQ